MNEKISSVSVWMIVLIGLGLFAAQFAWVIYNTYVPIFLQAGSPQFDNLMSNNNSAYLKNGFGLNAVQTGFIMSLDNIAAFLFQPLIGMLSDRTYTRLGRRTPYLLVGMPAAALVMALLPLAIPSEGVNPQGLFVIFLACLLLMVIAMACWRAPIFALMADLTPSSKRSFANGILNLMAGLGGILAFIVGSLLYAIYRPFPFWGSGLIMLIACGLIIWRVREPLERGENDSTPIPPLGRWLWDWRASLPPERRHSLTLLIIAVFFYMMGFHPIEAFFSSYGVSKLGLSEANSGLVLSAAYITFILFAVPAGLLAGRMGRKYTVLAGLVLFAGSLLIAFFTPITWVMVILMGLGGLAWALIDINAFPMILDIAPNCKSTRAGTATAVYFIATSLAATFGPIVNGWMIDLYNRDYNMIFLIGPVFFGFSFICMLQVRQGHGEPT